MNNLILESKIAYKFVNSDLLIEALSHPSLRHRRQTQDTEVYERLEFLGDSVLNLIISTIIFNQQPNYDEGQLAQLRSSLVCKEQICKVAHDINLAEFIMMTEGEEKSGGRKNQNNIENTMEALIGAIYIDGGFDTARNIVESLWKKYLDQPIDEISDKKSYLQEWAHANKLSVPKYTVLEKSGSMHEPTFTVEVEVGSLRYKASASSIKAAEKKAASSLIQLYIKS